MLINLNIEAIKNFDIHVFHSYIAAMIKIALLIIGEISIFMVEILLKI